MKILVIDDDRHMLETYKELLNSQGYEIETAEDPISAMAKYHSFKPDLIILDVGMPAGGGKKVFDTIRKTLLSNIPIIFSTAKEELIEKEAKLPNCSLIKKPFNPEQLFIEIKKYQK